MKKNLLFIFLALIVFASGFLTHALFFPDFLANGIVDIQQIALPQPTPTSAPGQSYAFETRISYTQGHFSRHNITVGVGNYLTIINTSNDYPMWLTSNDPNLSTPRGYGQSEQVRERMDASGQYVVADSKNPSERMIITVK